MKRIILAILFLIILIVAGYYLLINKDSKKIKIDTDLSDKSDLIVVSSPIKDSPISSPLRISGRARGRWYFEGSFPVELVDEYRNTIAIGTVASQGEWMTEDFVPFLGTLQFNNYIKGQKGFLILKKDNPSGQKKSEDSIEIPIVFK